MFRVAALLAVLAISNGYSQNKMFDGIVNAPEFPDGLSWLNSTAPIKLKELRGKFVLLDFWTFCCINCMHVIPDLKKLEAKYAEELVVIGVHSAKFRNEKETTQIREAVLRYGVKHPVVNDADFQIWNSYTAKAWPTFVLINPIGKIIGSMSGEGVYAPVDQLLSEAIPYFLAKKQLLRSPLNNTLEAAARPETLLSYPGKISADAAGRRLFISDSSHHRILITSASGKILDVIGSGDEGAADGAFETAQMNQPQGTFLHNDILYIADTENHLLRAANLKTRQLQTVLGTGEQALRLNVPGTGRTVALNSPWDVLVENGQAYIAMAGSHQIWSADIKTWQAQPFAGSARENISDGKRSEAALAQTSGLASNGKQIYFADSETSSIRSVDLGPEGRVKTLVGKGLFDFGDQDGACASARFQHPLGVALAGDLLYVADTYNSKIKAIQLSNCRSETMAGDGSKTLRNGKAASAAFNEPGGLAWLDQKLYVADTNNHVIRVIDVQQKSVSSLELTGLEKRSSRRQDHFNGRELRLNPIDVQPGHTSLVVSIQLPAGYKLNHEAPLYLHWTGLDAEQAAETLQFPVKIPITSLQGKTDLTIDAIIYYCTSEQSVCLVDRIRTRVELRPAQSAPATIPLTLAVRKPGKV
ncbi:thioredoxin-like domain-containing protein [Bryobacter aggregatus]|uniref:thioredoxin-like domain-containing protein n=1 Tax=Bryobacter aggregatus TaxID=360054 RepID=UPI0006910709|nr:thioredoxin-like domain-containing protein [Bryobacter aggregatus]